MSNHRDKARGHNTGNGGRRRCTRKGGLATRGTPSQVHLQRQTNYEHKEGAAAVRTDDKIVQDRGVIRYHLAFGLRVPGQEQGIDTVYILGGPFKGWGDHEPGLAYNNDLTEPGSVRLNKHMQLVSSCKTSFIKGEREFCQHCQYPERRAPHSR